MTTYYYYYYGLGREANQTECDRPAEPAPRTPFARVLKKYKLIFFPSRYCRP